MPAQARMKPGLRSRRARWVSGGLAALVAVPVALGMASSGAAASSAMAYVGRSDGTSAAYRATTVGGAWTRVADADLPDAGSNGTPTLVDLDGNKVLDAIVGERGGAIVAYRNTGSDLAPAWVAQPAWDVPNLGPRSAPAAADLDRDGDPDLLVGVQAGVVVGIQNVGTRTAPAWWWNPAWDLATLGTHARPAAGDVNNDGRPDVMVGLDSGATIAYLGTGDAGHPLERDVAWDLPDLGSRVTPAAADLDGDGRADVLLVDTSARVFSAQHNTGAGFAADTAFPKPPDPGSGPGGLAVAVFGALTTPTSAPAPTTVPATPPTTKAPAPTPTSVPTTTTTAPGAPPTTTAPSGLVAKLNVAPASGVAPLAVVLDASQSVAQPAAPLTYTWDFGDGTAPPPPGDNKTMIAKVKADYALADKTRDEGHQLNSVPMYMATVTEALPLVNDPSPAGFTVNGFSTIDKLARFYLSIIGHDLGGIYRNHPVPGFESGCIRFQTSYLYYVESVEQAKLGGFPTLPDNNGTSTRVQEALGTLADKKCAVPPYQPMFGSGLAAAGAGAVGAASQSHAYTKAGTYTAKVTVSDGARTSVATAVITAAAPATPPTTVPGPTTPPTTTAPGGGGGGGGEPQQGFGAQTRGGDGGEVVTVSEPTMAAVKAAITKAKQISDSGKPSKIVFAVTGKIDISDPLDVFANNLTIEGNGVTLDGVQGGLKDALLEIGGHDVIVRNMRLRHGGDNLRAQGKGAYNIVFSHVSVTGGRDDGISIAFGAHDVTVQYSFLAGNSRSLFLKYDGSTRITIHHTWIQKQLMRGPLASSAFVDFRNNILEDWANWGLRYEAGADGNVVNSVFGYGSYPTGKWGKTANAINVMEESTVFVSGNVFQGTANEGPTKGRWGSVPQSAPAVDTQTAAAMEPVVRSRAGAMPRDSIDQAYINLSGGWAFEGDDGAPSGFGNL